MARGLLLLIASLNVSSLLLVRTEKRKREIAVRSALGASPSRLILQFITEGLVLVAISSVIGFATASWAIQLLVQLVPANVVAGMPYLHETRLSAHVVVFAIFVSVLAAILFSVIPMVRPASAALQENLHGRKPGIGCDCVAALWLEHCGAGVGRRHDAPGWRGSAGQESLPPFPCESGVPAQPLGYVGDRSSKSDVLKRRMNSVLSYARS